MKQITRGLLIIAWTALLCSCGTSKDTYPREAVEASCKNNHLHINKKLAVTDLYVDRTYLRILLKPYDESYYVEDLVKFLFETKLTSIETTNRDENGNALVFSLPNDPNAKVIRLSIKPVGHSACNVYDYPNRYPAQALPWLRKLGLKEDSCVGIEGLPSPKSKAGIYVSEHLVGQQFNWMNWQKRIDVTLADSSGTVPTIAATLIDHYSRSGGGNAGIHYGFPCGTRDSQVKAFREAFDARGNQQISPPTLVEVPPYELAATYPSADDRWLRTLHWIARPGKVWSSNLINAEGTAWVEWNPSRNHLGHTFNSLSSNTIFSSPVLIPEKGLQDVTGFARTAKGYALIASVGRGPDVPRYILEFNTRGQNISIATLNRAQYNELTSQQ